MGSVPEWQGLKENGGDSPPTCSPSRQRGKFRLAVPQADLHRDFAFIKFSGWRRQLCAVQRFAVAAFANSFSALLPFLLLRSAEERGAAAEDGQASGGMIKREFSMRSWRAGGHFLQPGHSCCDRSPRRG